MNVVRFSLCTAAIGLGLCTLPAMAELPSHPNVQVLHPTNAEVSNGTSAPPNAYFGEAIAVYKSMALVGMPDTSTGSVMETGRVGVFTRKSGVWVRTGTFLSPAPRAGGHFGRLVALENDGALIADETTVYVYKYTLTTGWKVVQWVRAPSSDSGVSYPDTLDFRCNTVAAAARSSSAQLVYLYDRLADGKLSFKARLTSPTHDPNEDFGAAVAVDCNLAVVGAPDFTYPTTNPGSAYVFRRVSDKWHFVQDLSPSGGMGRDGFGSAVATNQQTIFVGAPVALTHIDESSETAEQGAVYIFTPTSGTYAQTDRLQPDPSEHDHYSSFGDHLGVTDDHLFAEAHAFNFGGISMREENLIFSYTRSAGTAHSVGIARGVVEGGDFFASGNRLFVGTPDDDRCFECIGAVYIYDFSTTE
jgi:hypothetical protein